jgi:geranylgeranyl transferase type-1 subunit beta
MMEALPVPQEMNLMVGRAPKLPLSDGSIGLLLSPTAGLTYCALGTLSFLGQLSETVAPQRQSSEMRSNLLGWLASRQTTEIDEEDDQESETQLSELSLSDQPELDPDSIGGPETTNPEAVIASLPVLPDISDETPGPAGFNGRLNKTADTCYCFWVTGSLAVTSTPTSFSRGPTS